MMPPPILTRDTEAFHRAHVRPEPAFQALLRPGFERFFAVRLEEMYQLMRPPTRTCGCGVCLFFAARPV